jgi:hypothetical protein
MESRTLLWHLIPKTQLWSGCIRLSFQMVHWSISLYLIHPHPPLHFQKKQNTKKFLFDPSTVLPIPKTDKLHICKYNTTYPPSTLKFSVQVTSWPFKSLENTLTIVLDTTVTNSTSSESESDGCGDSGVSNGVSYSEDYGYLDWVKISQDGLTLYHE